jgi:hypothetical protein
MVAPKPKKPKPDVERRATYARGGSTRMFGRDDRTETATTDAAGEQTPGQTASKSKDNLRFAAGGEKVPRSVGGLARRARPGECGT